MSLPSPNGLLEKLRNGKRSRSWPLRVAGIVGFLVTVFLLVSYNPGMRIALRPHSASHERPLHNVTKPLPYRHALESHIAHLEEIQRWQPPPGMRVIGLVFYGRRRFVTILNCYLQRNLVENGGIIEEYIFVVRTEDEEDLAYLEELLVANPKYSAHRSAGSGFDYSQMWSAVEAGNVYVKIDDDVVRIRASEATLVYAADIYELYIEDSTIRSIVKRKVEHPEYIVVSANLVVQFALTWLHYHLGALHPYLPELTHRKSYTPTTSWRSSELPYWDGPADFNMTSFEAPDHHRWLPLAPGGVVDLEKTPIADVKYGVGGISWEEWTVGAQQHYSFLENLEKDELWRYGFEMWDFHYDRLSINLIAIMGDDVIAMGPMPRDDEELITQIYSKQTGRHVVADGYGVAVHHGYWLMSEHDGKKGMETTDVLDRYRAYAQENICKS
ncbi:hypothetical protein MMC15_005364 [Xylographa vitiligo]|nr:hypothetical protein [Xylographa vitiligo]